MPTRTSARLWASTPALTFAAERRDHHVIAEQWRLSKLSPYQHQSDPMPIVLPLLDLLHSFYLHMPYGFG
jgi:hypothetical protein